MTDGPERISALTAERQEELAARLIDDGLRRDFVENLLAGVYGDELEFACRAAFLRQERRDRKRSYREE